MLRTVRARFYIGTMAMSDAIAIGNRKSATKKPRAEPGA
jgi:hypothetical protein